MLGQVNKSRACVTRVCSLFLFTLPIIFSFHVSLANITGSLPTAVTSGDNQIPEELKDIQIVEHLGSQIDLGLKFRDESGQSVELRRFFSGHKPVILALAYYQCPNLCTLVLNGTVESLKKLEWNSGKEFEVVVVSFDPTETHTLASAKKDAYLKEYGRKEGEAGWHFLTGDQPAIAALTKQVGFNYKWSDEQRQFAHASVIFVLTPEGKISRYFYGIDYPPRDMKVAMLEASQGKIGNMIDRILLFCFHYDSSTKKYVLLASRIMTLGRGVTLFIMTLMFLRIWIRERRLSVIHHQRGQHVG